MARNSLIRQFLLDTIGLVGDVLGGTQAAASGDLAEIRAHAFLGTPKVPLTAADAAAGAVKNAPPPHGDWESEAQFNGLDPDRFRALVALTGNPPGPMELVDQWRRGLIDDATMDHGIRQGYIKDEWIPFFHALRHLPINVADAVQAAVQNHLPHDQAAKIADSLGIDGANFEVLFENAGNPPGPMELLNLWNRGVLDQAAVVQGLRESRLKDKYIDALLKLRRRLIPFRSITQLLNAGAITDAEATTRLHELGYDAASIAAILAGHKAGKKTSHKIESATTIRGLYVDHVITRAQAHEALVKIGFDDQGAEDVLTLADAVAEHNFQRAAITKIGALYVRRRLTRAGAASDIDKLGVTADQRNKLLALWDLEREASAPTLSLGQLNQAYKKGVIDLATFSTRVEALGYSAADTHILASIDVPPAPA